jgi:hypothetical protein
MEELHRALRGWKCEGRRLLDFSKVNRVSYMVYILRSAKGPGTRVQVVTKKENGMRCIGEARGMPGKAWESGPRHRKATWQSTRECSRVWQSTRECSRAWQNTAEHSKSGSSGVDKEVQGV